MHEIMSDYLGAVFDVTRFQETVRRMIAKAGDIKTRYNFDSIAFTGTSGASVGFLMANHFGVDPLCIRKGNDSSHYVAGHGNDRKPILEGNRRARRYLIVDDFVGSGQTLKSIIRCLNDVGAKSRCLKCCVGVLVFDGSYKEFESITIDEHEIKLPYWSVSDRALEDSKQETFRNLCYRQNIYMEYGCSW